MPAIPTITLNDTRTMPCLGLGLWKVDDAGAAAIVREGLAAGYRLFDTASMYKNEAGVGDGLRDAPVDRENLFITTKLWNDRHGFDEARRSFDESMSRLRLDYLDLFLIHWPVAGSDAYVDTWRALIRLREEGRVRSIGVSNFLEPHIRRIVQETGVVPAVNQIEYHPYFQQPAVARFNAETGVRTESWGPLGRGGAVKDARIVEIAARLGKSPAQVILRWHLDMGFVVIPKSANPGRMRENLDVFDFRLSAEDMSAIANLHRGERTGGDPMTFTGLP